MVDNASTDGSVEMIEAKFPWVKLIKSSENLGFAKGNNVAIRQCQGRYVALVNPDVIVFPGCLDALADFLDENPKGGQCRSPRVQPGHVDAEHVPAISNSVEQLLFGDPTWKARFKGNRFFAGEHMFYFPHDRTLAVDVIVGCFSMIRREAFDEVGLLDEDLFMYGDDVDWCRRASECRMGSGVLPRRPGDPRSREDHGVVPGSLCSRAAALGPALLEEAS